MGIWFLSLLINSGCNRDLVEYDSNDLKISIEKGEEWLHNFPSLIPQHYYKIFFLST